MLVSGLFLLSNPGYTLTQNPGQNNSHPSLHLFFHADSAHIASELEPQALFQDYLSRLERLKARSKSDHSFLKKAFFKTHRVYLHNYDASASLPQTMKSGLYGCLSGTAIYAMILDHFDYDFEIVELTTHVYLQVHLAEKTVLIESTLPETGFITDSEEIARITQQYLDKSRNSNSIMAISGLNQHTEGKKAYQKSISLTQLSGLQYYNRAIYNLGEESYQQAFDNAQKSMELYPSNRTEKLMEIVINKILQSKTLSKDQKSGILNTYIRQVKKKKLTQR